MLGVVKAKIHELHIIQGSLERAGQMLSGDSGVRVKFDAATPHVNLENNEIHLVPAHQRDGWSEHRVYGVFHHEVGHIVIDAGAGSVAKYLKLEPTLWLWHDMITPFSAVEQQTAMDAFNAVADPRQERLYCEHYPGVREAISESTEELFKGDYSTYRVNSPKEVLLTLAYACSEFGETSGFADGILAAAEGRRKFEVPSWVRSKVEAVVEGSQLKLVAAAIENFYATYRDTRAFLAYVLALHQDLWDNSQAVGGGSRNERAQEFLIETPGVGSSSPKGSETGEQSGESKEGAGESKRAEKESFEELQEKAKAAGEQIKKAVVECVDPEAVASLKKLERRGESSFEDEMLSEKGRQIADAMLNKALGGRSASRGWPSGVRRFRGVNPCPMTGPEQEGRRLAFKLMTALQARSVTYEIPDQEEGYIDPDNIYKLVTGHADDFFYEETKVDLPSEKDTSISLLLDTSGSMSGVMETCKEAFYSLGAALNALAIPFELYSFNSTVTQIKTYTDSWAAKRGYIKGLRATGGTALAPALAFARESTQAMRNKRKLMFIITDGVPYEPKRVEVEIAAAVRLGFEIVPFTYDFNSGIFKESVKFHRFEDMVPQLIGILTRYFNGEEITLV